MRRALPMLLVGAAFLASAGLAPMAAPLYRAAFPGIVPAVYDRGSLLALAASQLALVGAALLAAASIGIGGAVLVTRPRFAAFRPLLGTVATLGQSFPPAAVLALLVPVLGFGARPTLVALALYGLLPITGNTLAGIDGVAPAVMEAARGMGMSPAQILRRVELPLAWPMILAGLRIAAVVGLGTATIGSTVGALTLGTPIIDGLIANKPNFVLQGAIPLALLAVLLELGFEAQESGSFLKKRTKKLL